MDNANNPFLHAEDLADLASDSTAELLGLRAQAADVLARYERGETNYAGHEGNPWPKERAEYALACVNHLLKQRPAVG